MKLPNEIVRDYIGELYRKILDDRLFHAYADQAKKILTVLISEFIHDVIHFNNIKYNFDYPLGISFGGDCKWVFVCASNELLEKQYRNERLDHVDFCKVLRPYFLLVES